MDNSDSLLLDNQLCFSIYSTSLAFTQLYKPMLKSLNLTYPQYLIMMILWEQDGIGLKDIADKLGQKSGSITPVIKRMELDGLVSRSRSTSDERNLQIELTVLGQKMRAQAKDLQSCLIEKSGIEVDKIQDLKASLDALRKTMLSTM